MEQVKEKACLMRVSMAWSTEHAGAMQPVSASTKDFAVMVMKLPVKWTQTRGLCRLILQSITLLKIAPLPLLPRRLHLMALPPCLFFSLPDGAVCAILCADDDKAALHSRQSAFCTQFYIVLQQGLLRL